MLQIVVVVVVSISFFSFFHFFVHLCVASFSFAKGLSPREMSALYKKLGDLGDVAAAGKRHQRTLVQLKPLGIKGLLAARKRSRA